MRSRSQPAHGDQPRIRPSGFLASEVWSLHLAAILVGGTGILYAVVRYLWRNEDPFALVNRPWQVHLQHLHVITAPLLVFAFGLAWRIHAWARWRHRTGGRRISGVVVATAAPPMILSGVLIQTATSAARRRRWVLVHLATSLVWLSAYVIQVVWRRIQAPNQ